MAGSKLLNKQNEKYFTENHYLLQTARHNRKSGTRHMIGSDEGMPGAKIQFGSGSATDPEDCCVRTSELIASAQLDLY